MKTQIIPIGSVCDINFKDLKKSGIDCVLFDIEGTIAPWGKGGVPKEVLSCIERSGIAKRAVVTNMSKKHANRASNIAKSIGAESCQYPLNKTYRKPRARMLELAMNELAAKPTASVMVGDKVFDALAAKNAKVQCMFWVDKMGATDHWFDRYVYRRIEPLLKRLLR